MYHTISDANFIFLFTGHDEAYLICTNTNYCFSTKSDKLAYGVLINFFLDCDWVENCMGIKHTNWQKCNPSIFKLCSIKCILYASLSVKYVGLIDQFRYIKIQSQTVDLRMRLWGINPTNSVFIPQSLALRSIVLG